MACQWRNIYKRRSITDLGHSNTCRNGISSSAGGFQCALGRLIYAVIYFKANSLSFSRCLLPFHHPKVIGALIPFEPIGLQVGVSCFVKKNVGMFLQDWLTLDQNTEVSLGFLKPWPDLTLTIPHQLTWHSATVVFALLIITNGLLLDGYQQ